ncbi:MarR family winged helix-turn-helix transcriptional regulator [Corynebacterium terpenotabidum]|uniref:MarR family transcriptional regulator n=1 Tax=Corynebacterium terpenotabidum Y-11 TaxID=1200352 RepID=S4XM76_9CORY|nr:MarR family winged helix-turn-helix transcriptional regulator [Corynebacterium terpenotabidum]AGP31738.1 MarR family transcriptional regulator [Corynebacterium terpenotabidum Y-11]
MSADVNPGATNPVDLADVADLILRAARHIQAIEVCESGGIPLTHLEAMMMTRIDDEPGITPTQLRTALELRSSNMSAALKSLEDKGLVTRTPDAVDGRVTRIRPTAFAAGNLTKVREAWCRGLARVAGDDPQDIDDLAAAVRVLRRISERWG